MLMTHFAQVEAMVLFFARVLDIEVHHQPSRLHALLRGVALDQYRKRIGAANILVSCRHSKLSTIVMQLTDHVQF